jgi:hypothetical protein
MCIFRPVDGTGHWFEIKSQISAVGRHYLPVPTLVQIQGIARTLSEPVKPGFDDCFIGIDISNSDPDGLILGWADIPGFPGLVS